MVTLYSVKIDPLRGILPDWILDTTTTEVRVPERVRCVTCVTSISPSASPNRMVKIRSNPQEGVIVLHPDYYTPGTAGGEALRAHELYHIWQRKTYPNFEQEFARVAAETEQAGKPPWDNPYEKPAYEFEEKVRAHLASKGLPDRWLYR